MPSLSQRIRHLQTKLLAIRTGPGALVLPKDVKRIHMQFAAKQTGGHMGPRKFWHEDLVRLKYHNPAVPMTVDRSILASDSAILSIHFAPANAQQTSDSATSSPAPINSTSESMSPGHHDPVERVETIHIKNRDRSEILEELIRVTKAYEVAPTPEDVELARSLEEQKVRSLEDSKRSKEVRARAKREKELLEQARGDLAPQAA